MFSKKLVGILIVSLGAAGAAHATSVARGFDGEPHRIAPKHQFLWFYGLNHKDPKKPMVAPEIDPATALSGLTMLAGGLAVIRGRRVRK